MKDEIDVRADAINLVALALNDDPRARELAASASGDEEDAQALRDATVAVLLSITLADVDPRETLDLIRLELHEQEFTN